MTEEACDAIVKKNIFWVAWALQVHTWIILVKYDKTIDSCATALSDGAHKEIKIVINNALHDCEDEVLDTIGHELCHCFDAPIDTCVAAMVDEQDVNVELCHEASETLNILIRNMLNFGLGLTWKDIIERAKMSIVNYQDNVMKQMFKWTKSHG